MGAETWAGDAKAWCVLSIRSVASDLTPLDTCTRRTTFFFAGVARLSSNDSCARIEVERPLLGIGKRGALYRRDGDSAPIRLSKIRRRSRICVRAERE
jgi:hypothetical protein